MSKKHPHNPPNPDLKILIRDGGNALDVIDFNRFNYFLMPQSKVIESRGGEFIERKLNADDIFHAFNNTDYAPAYLHGLFIWLRKYIIFCDKIKAPAFSEESVNFYVNELIERHKGNNLKNSTFTGNISGLKRTFIILDLPHKFFDNYPTLGRTQAEPYKSYSDKDLNKLLPILKSFFDQLAGQFLSTPHKHLSGYKFKATMSFEWMGKIYPVYSGVVKMMASAVYLLAFYSWANTTTLLMLPRPEKGEKDGKAWYESSSLKRRASRIITIRIGEHDKINIEPHSMAFFEKLLKVSSVISPCKGSLLFSIKPEDDTGINAQQLGTLSRFINDNFSLKDDKNHPLYPVVSRFRATGSAMHQIHHTHRQASSMLSNSSRTVRRHYSDGNEFQNQAMMQDAVIVLSDKSKYKENIHTSIKRRKSELNVDILTYEQLLKLKSPPMRQAHGSYCNEPFGSQAEKFLLRTQRHGLLTTKKFACSDLLMCFSCPHQVIVSEVADIWCLLSFKECIEESIYKHLDSKHFRQNYQHIIEAIEKILLSVDSKTLKDARVKFSVEGPHPLWQEPSMNYPPFQWGS